MLEPIGDRIVVRPEKAEEMTSGGIILPDRAQETPHKGLVLAVGPGREEKGEYYPLQIKVGDTVYYTRYGGAEILIQGESVIILKESDVLAIGRQYRPE